MAHTSPNMAAMLIKPRDAAHSFQSAQGILSASWWVWDGTDGLRAISGMPSSGSYSGTSGASISLASEARLQGKLKIEIRQGWLVACSASPSCCAVARKPEKYSNAVRVVAHCGCAFQPGSAASSMAVSVAASNAIWCAKGPDGECASRASVLAAALTPALMVSMLSTKWISASVAIVLPP